MKAMNQALEGLLVVDFGWVLAGPLMSKYLADFGATVIKIESSSRPDNTRNGMPYRDGKPGLNRSAMFGFRNANKYSMTVNLQNPKGVEVVKRLVSRADVVCENFRPGTLDGWGLGYEQLKAIKPDIVMISLGIFGQTGSYSRHFGYGMQLVGISGFVAITGFPDREPVTPFGAMTDLMMPPLGVAAVLAALDWRRRTGEGQYLDLSQEEGSLQFLAPLLLDCSANNTVMLPQGNSSSGAAPHRVYRCRGEDRWCAITVSTDDEWRAFCAAMSAPRWATRPEFSTFLGRKHHEDELNGLVEAWTINFAPEELTVLLQQTGVAAGTVMDGRDVYSDPQLRERDFFWNIEHPEMGRFAHLGQVVKLRNHPSTKRQPAPCLGEHTEMVCRDIIGMSDEEFVQLLAEGVFQ